MIQAKLIVRLFGRSGGREDKMGMACCLIDIDIDRNKKVESRKRSFKLCRVRRATQWVGHHQNHSPDLPFTWSEYLLGHSRGWNHPFHFELATDAARLPSDSKGSGLRQRGKWCCGSWEHRAPGTI